MTHLKTGNLKSVEAKEARERKSFATTTIQQQKNAKNAQSQ